VDESVRTFARRLRQERERAGMTQTELAKRVAELLGTALDPSALTRVEKFERGVRLEEAVRIAQVLDVPLASLLDEVDDGLEVQIEEQQRGIADEMLRVAHNELELKQARAAIEKAQRRLAELEGRR